MSSLLDILGSITSGVGGVVKYRYISSFVDSDSGVLGSLDYLIASEHLGIYTGGGTGYAWGQAERIEDAYAGEMSATIVCKSIVIGTLITYRNMSVTIPCRIAITGTLSAYNDANVISRGKSVVVGRPTSIIDYELARQEDEIFLLSA